jgi:hypothetical protein
MCLSQKQLHPLQETYLRLVPIHTPTHKVGGEKTNGLYSLSSLDSSKGHFSKYTKRKGHAIYYLTFSSPKNPKEDPLKLCFALLCIVWSALAALGQLLHSSVHNMAVMLAIQKC